MGRGHRVKTPRIFLGKQEFSGDGVSCPQVESIKWECDAVRMKEAHFGAGYKTKQGVINVEFKEDGPPPPKMTEEEIESHLIGVVLVQQYNLNQGIKLFGARAEETVEKELRQINNLETYIPKMASELTWEEKRKALESLLFITEKRNGNIKARQVRDGSKQRTYDVYDNSDGSLPIFLTGVVDARERRATAILDVANAFLHANNDKYVLMLLQGKLAELMVKVNPSLYRKYVTTSKEGVLMLYVQLSKALYRMLHTPLLFYKKLRSNLEDMGFEINPSDPCVANKMVDEK